MREADGYVPTTDEMRAFYTAERRDGPHLAGFPKPGVDQAEEEFNHWLNTVRAGRTREIIEIVQDHDHWLAVQIDRILAERYPNEVNQ